MDFWDQLLRLSFHGEPRRSWERLGENLRLVEPALLPVGRFAKWLACPKCGCNHKIFPVEAEDQIRAVCQCEDATCDDLLLPKASVELLAVDARKLPKLLGGCLPMAPRLFPSNHAAFSAWRLGLINLRPDGRPGSLVVCFSAKALDLNNAALGVSQNDFGPTVFVCRTVRAEQLEAVLPPDSMVIDFDDFWISGAGGFVPGKSARRLLSGWEDEVPPPVVGTQLQNGYFFERRGQKKTKFNNESYDLTTWRCWIEGRNIDLPDVVGSELLVRILLRRGDLIYADSLLRSLSGEATDVVDDDGLEWLGKEELQKGTKRFTPNAPDVILSTDDISDWMKKIRQLERAIVECGDDPGLAAEKEGLMGKRDDMVDYLLKSTRPGPGNTLLPKEFDGELKAAGNLVGKHIRGVIDQIRGIDEGFWSHLANKSILKAGQVCQYDSEFGYNWRKKSENFTKER